MLTRTSRVRSPARRASTDRAANAVKSARKGSYPRYISEEVERLKYVARSRRAR